MKKFIALIGSFALLSACTFTVTTEMNEDESDDTVPAEEVIEEGAPTDPEGVPVGEEAPAEEEAPTDPEGVPVGEEAPAEEEAPTDPEGVPLGEEASSSSEDTGEAGDATGGADSEAATE